jgi:hypothetical protein
VKVRWTCFSCGTGYWFWIKGCRSCALKVLHRVAMRMMDEAMAEMINRTGIEIVRRAIETGQLEEADRDVN